PFQLEFQGEKLTGIYLAKNLTYFELQQLRDQLKDYVRRTIENYRTIFNQDPQNISARVELIRIYRAVQKYRGIFSVLEHTLQADPGNRGAWREVADTLVFLGSTQFAVEKIKGTILGELPGSEEHLPKRQQEVRDIFKQIAQAIPEYARAEVRMADPSAVVDRVMSSDLVKKLIPEGAEQTQRRLSPYGRALAIQVQEGKVARWFYFELDSKGNAVRQIEHLEFLQRYADDVFEQGKNLISETSGMSIAQAQNNLPEHWKQIKYLDGEARELRKTKIKISELESALERLRGQSDEIETQLAAVNPKLSFEEKILPVRNRGRPFIPFLDVALGVLIVTLFVFAPFSLFGFWISQAHWMAMAMGVVLYTFIRIYQAITAADFYILQLRNGQPSEDFNSLTGLHEILFRQAPQNLGKGNHKVVIQVQDSSDFRDIKGYLNERRGTSNAYEKIKLKRAYEPAWLFDFRIWLNRHLFFKTAIVLVLSVPLTILNFFTEGFIQRNHDLSGFGHFKELLSHINMWIRYVSFSQPSYVGSDTDPRELSFWLIFDAPNPFGVVGLALITTAFLWLINTQLRKSKAPIKSGREGAQFSRLQVWSKRVAMAAVLSATLFIMSPEGFNISDRVFRGFYRSVVHTIALKSSYDLPIYELQARIEAIHRSYERDFYPPYGLPPVKFSAPVRSALYELFMLRGNEILGRNKVGLNVDPKIERNIILSIDPQRVRQDNFVRFHDLLEGLSHYYFYLARGPMQLDEADLNYLSQILSIIKQDIESNPELAQLHWQEMKARGVFDSLKEAFSDLTKGQYYIGKSDPDLYQRFMELKREVEKFEEWGQSKNLSDRPEIRDQDHSKSPRAEVRSGEAGSQQITTPEISPTIQRIQTWVQTHQGSFLEKIY
ncbi:MAG: hypothetical protein HY515_00800, partial [Candidatus Aenigmarchaeota archaeon]|nr:hypothetical protein [Candidatus Aenigmarchaeota archaeon]